MSSTINWHKWLYKSWKEYSTKKKADKKCTATLQSFEKNIKKQLSDIELHLQRKDYTFGPWDILPKTKDGGGIRFFIIPVRINDRIAIKAINTYLSNILRPSFNKVQNISYA